MILFEAVKSRENVFINNAIAFALNTSLLNFFRDFQRTDTEKIE